MTVIETLPGRLSESDSGLARRFTASAAVSDGALMPNAEFHAWFAEQRRVHQFEVTPIPFADLKGWHFQPENGNLAHDSGRFFSIEGLRLRTGWEDRGSWSQPIIIQPEIGILGIAVKEFDGVLHCLMQAKMEPGNINTVQLSPTVQATRSNYTGAHHGRGITHLEYFAPPGRSRVLVDVLQAEQGSWFLHKRNRNMVVEVFEDVPPHEDFCWLTLGQIRQLLRQDNVVNMDARTVLSCIPFDAPDSVRSGAGYGESLLRSLSDTKGSLHSTAEIRSWLIEAKTHHELVQRKIPLPSVERWHRTDRVIAHEQGKYFTMIAAEVAASNREVARWSQPLLAPVGQGVIAFVVKPIDGVLHLLVRARIEAGAMDVAQMGPTVQCTPENYRDASPEQRPRFLDLVLNADPAAIRYDTIQSEEGGRFHHAASRYLIVQAPAGFPDEVPEGYCWVTAGQAADLLRHSNYFNVEARSLIAALHATW